MKLFFIDETDRQRDTQLKRTYFVLCGLMIDSEDLIKADTEFDDIKNQHNLKNLKDTRKKGLSKKERLEITNKVFGVLKKYKAEVRAIYLGEYTMKAEREISDTYFGALDFLIERLFLTLKKKDSSGLIVMDNLNKKTEAILKKKYFQHIREGGQVWITSGRVDPYKNRICPWLIFSEDDCNTFLQVTDLIAASLNSAIWESIGSDNFSLAKLPEKNKFLDIYWPLFVRSPKGTVGGWGIKIWN